MRTIKVLLKKEFKQIFRNKSLLPLIFVFPVIQLLVLVFAATFDIKEATMVISDKDNSKTSRELVEKFETSEFFKIILESHDSSVQNDLFCRDKADIVLKIPLGFEKNLVVGDKNNIQILLNAVNSAKAGIISGYIYSVFEKYNIQISSSKGLNNLIKKQEIVVSSSYWYNKNFDYYIYMVPGILTLLITIIGMFLAALNMVREKEIGTAEQINVTPIKRYHFIICKLLPFWVIAMFELGFGLIIGRLVFDLPMIGSVPLLFGFAAIYLVVALGIGLLLSTMASSQQQVTFYAYFFLLTFIIMSGIFTPVESMPKIGQYINYINPLYYFMKIIRMILLTGAQFTDLIFEFIILVIYGVVINSLAILNYKKTN